MQGFTPIRSAVFAAAMAFAGTSSASQIDFLVSAAEVDEFGASGGHALALSGLATIGGAGSGGWVFEPPATGFATIDTTAGTGRLEGRIANLADPSYRLDLTVSFTGGVDYDQILIADPSSPKLELSAAAYQANGGPVDPRTWTYYTEWSGVLAGVAGTVTEGATVSLVARGPAAQLGEGANNKNVDNGFSAWLSWELTGSAIGLAADGARGDGDINVRLVTAGSAIVPEPPALLLAAVGLLFLPWVRRAR